MRTDIETQIRLRREQLQDLKRELNELEQQRRAVRNNVEKCKQAIVRHGRQERDLQLETQRAEDEVERLQEDLDKDDAEDGRLEVLKAHLEQQQEVKRVNEGSYQDAVVALDGIKEKLKEGRAALASMDERIHELEAAAKKAESETLKMSRKRTTALGEKNAAMERIEDGKRDKQSLERQREELEERVKVYIDGASGICARVNIDAGETYKSLETKFEKLGTDLQKFDRNMGASRDEIGRQAQTAIDEYKNALGSIRELETLSQKLKETLVNRRERWEKFRAYIVSRAKTQFTYLLSERSFRGRLITSHKQKLLDLQVSMFWFAKMLTILMEIRWSLTLPGMAVDVVQELCPEERSRSHKYACCCLYGRQWAPLYVVSMSCKHS